jgi:hypothetical protein
MDLLTKEPETTPRGHDVGLLREMLALTPEERIRRNEEWVEMIEKLRASAAAQDEIRRDLPRPPR